MHKRKKDRILKGILFAGFLAALAPAFIFLKGYIILSGSMEPAVGTGSLCLVNRLIPYDMIEPGDIIAFTTSLSGTAVHRVAGFDGEGLITKGDANRIEDGERVGREAYLGKAVLAIPYLGRILNVFGNTFGRILLAGICLFAAGLIILTSQSGNRRKGAAET